MITAPFQRRITNPLQRPVAADLNLQAFYDSVTQSYMAGAFFSGPSFPSTSAGYQTGFIGNGFAPVASDSFRGVVIKSGIGFMNVGIDDIEGVGGIDGVNEYALYAPMVCQPSNSPGIDGVLLLIDAESAGQTRIDLVCVKAVAAVSDYQNIGLLNPSSSTFSFASRPQQLTFNETDIIVVKGTPSTGTPTPPAVPSGYTTVAAVLAPSGSGLIPNANIADGRTHLLPFGTSTFAASVMSKDTTNTSGVWEATGSRYLIIPGELTPSGSSDVWKTFALVIDGADDFSNAEWTAIASLPAIPSYGTINYGSLGLRVSSAMVVQSSLVASSAYRASFDAAFPGESFALHSECTVVTFVVGNVIPLTGAQQGTYIDFKKASVEASNILDYRVTIRADI